MKKIRISIVILTVALMFSNCSSNEDMNTNNDLTSPVVRINSPDNLIQSYSTDIGNSNVRYRVIFQGYGLDETELKTLKLTVTNSNGAIVFEKIQEADIDDKYSVDVYENFETTTPDTYTITFTATDTNGNITSESRMFTYSD